MNDEKFSVVKRAQSFTHAGRGILMFLKTTHNAWLQVAVLLIAVALGVYFKITVTEWTLLVIVAGMVFVAEAFNTAIEIDMNLTSPEFHPFARDTKDVAAGAVLIASVIALIVGALIFYKYIFK
ncbi:MAG TPA: diacylglycerol kinase family protein [Candidatus Paceibacterota bacterium]